MPIKEISAESVRDKSIRHGHISTLHLWWARRPLPVCRAVVFASLVYDPLDAHCPPAFREAVERLLGGSDYKPYPVIPYTTGDTAMPDNLRNRLLMFIGKFSDVYVRNVKNGKETPAKEQLSRASLIMWDNKNNEDLLNIARNLIWVAYQSGPSSPFEGGQGDVNKASVSLNAGASASFETLSAEYDRYYQAIKDAEKELYQLEDRHLSTPETTSKEAALEKAIADFQDRMPSVFDPFAGGGAIPLEAARLGCRSYGNDINPVAHIIEKCSLEFPQKYGKKIIFSRTEFDKLYGKEGFDFLKEKNISFFGEEDSVEIANRLSFDVEYYARKLLKMAEAQAGHLYPADEKGAKPIAYYWARTATCSNPSCRAEVPLLKQFYLANTSSKKVYMKPIINGTNIDFEIEEGICEIKGWMTSSNLKCPCCGAITSTNEIKEQSKSKGLKNRLLVVICNSEKGKAYRIPSEGFLRDEEHLEINPLIIPNENMQKIPDLVSGRGWGIDKWSQMYSKRQLFVIQALLNALAQIKETFSPFRHAELDSASPVTAPPNRHAELDSASPKSVEDTDPFDSIHNIPLPPSKGELGNFACPFSKEAGTHNDTIVSQSEYNKAIITYLAILINRITPRYNMFGLWNTIGEKLEHIFGRQAIPMVFDYPESNVFAPVGGGGLNQLGWITKYIDDESFCPFSTVVNHASSGEKDQFQNKQITAVVTDPPYYDAIAYADLADFFYVWFKKTLHDVYPLCLATPQTPKTDECTALKHHHENDAIKANRHFETKLSEIFSAI